MPRDIGEWLDGLGLARYAEAFAANEIDLQALPHITDADLKEIGVALGARRKVLAAISELDGLRETGESNGKRERPPSAEAERRQLTVMFCDLVGSTALSERLDPEDLREVIHRYQNTVAGEASRFDGHVAKFMGDGVLVYFGFPTAHEDDAERAIRSGLGIIDAINRDVSAESRLAVRIGIATGHVVVGDLVGEGAAQEEAVIGETPNLAARLQDLAEPNSLMISESAHELLGGLFEFEEVGAQTVRGFAVPIECWRVIGERQVESRFEAVHGERLGRFVGRIQELSLLEERWTRARDGEGQVVLLTGEAGIGKSRLTRALMELAASELHTKIHYQCSPHHENSALYPFISELERAAGFEPADDPDVKYSKLEALLRQSSDEVGDALPLFASLLALPIEEDAARIELDPQRRKQRTFQAFLGKLHNLASAEPVLVVFEDVHWADPTSLELLEQIVDQVQQSRILCVITGRPEFRPNWPGHSHVTMLTLNRLRRRQTVEIVSDLTGGRELPDIVLDKIVERTDGVPLFVEELTKAVLESGLLEVSNNHYVLRGELGPLAIPSTLQDSLMARLDRLAPVKEVAQIGATIGRQFSHRLLTKVWPLGQSDLLDGLAQLVASDLLFRRGNPPDAIYTFKHALVQDVAYGSLLRSKRQEIHARIATVLVGRQPELAAPPEVIAHHFTEGGLIEKAIPHWQRAGQRAAERSADAEAHAHLQKALKLLEEMPDSTEHQLRELEILIVLGPVLMNLRGTPSTDVREAYLRARHLCEQVEVQSLYFPVIWGLWLHHQIAGEFDAALALAQEAIELAESLSNEDFLLQAHHAAWTSRMGLADYDSVVLHADQGLALYDVERFRTHAFTYGGHDPGVCAAIHGAGAKWFLGYAEQSEKHSETALEIAQQLNHPFSAAAALAYTAMVRLLRREPRRALPLLEELIVLSTDNDLALWRANGRIFRGWALSEMGNPSGALDDFRAGIQDRLMAGSQLRISLQLAAMADALAQAGEADEAQATIAQALEQVERIDERTYESVVHWFRGKILAAASEADPTEVEACYRLASELARQQGAKSMELRAAISLAGLLLNQGQKQEARRLLAPLYDWFTEGFDTPDLKDAKALLDKLS